MGFSIEDAFRVVSPLSVTVALLVGVAVGWMTVRGLDVESVISGLVQIGLPFFAVISAVRYAERSQEWDVWVGIGILYLVYAIGLTIGFWLRRRGGRRLP